MDAPRRILAAVPPGEVGHAVVARSADLAARFGARLRLASCVYDPYVAGERFPDSDELRAARAALVEARRVELEQLSAAIAGAVPGVELEVAWHHPVWEGLVADARDWCADLLVAGTFHHSFAQRVALANTDWQLLRHAPCPVLLTRRLETSDYADVMVAVDPMHAHDAPASLDTALLEAGGRLAAAYGGRLHVVHAYLTGQYMPLLAPGAAVPAVFYERQSPVERHVRRTAELAAAHGVPEGRRHVESGDARQVIPEVARRVGAGLIVMGVVARSRLGRFLIGSTAESVLDLLDCDVLAVKPPGAGP